MKETKKVETKEEVKVETKEEVKVETKEEVRDVRREAWDAYIAAYRISNPVKYAQKRATSVTQIGVDGKEYTVAKKDEFAEIPANFVAPKNFTN
jgi:hypothetical protein